MACNGTPTIRIYRICTLSKKAKDKCTYLSNENWAYDNGAIKGKKLKLKFYPVRYCTGATSKKACKTACDMI
jgi:hypothetical protein